MPLTFTILGVPSGPIVRNSGLWKPDGRKGECGRSISSRANIDQLVKTVEDFDDLFISYTYGAAYGKAWNILNDKF